MASPLQQNRLTYKPKYPPLFDGPHHFEEISIEREPIAELKPLFPHTFHAKSYRLSSGGSTEKKALRIGAIFSGGQASGGHNVLAGLFDSLHGGELIGFLNGPSGIVSNQSKKLDRAAIDSVRNQGGFDLIGSSRTKIETKEQLEAALQTVRAHRLDALIIIGGDDSNTNAAVLAEYFTEAKQPTRVIGVPKTIDGDLRSPELELSFGFDSACKTYSEAIGNIARDCLSAKKYYHFIKVMGRSASHIALECALSTHPNLTLIGEEGKSLPEIVKQIADLVRNRKAAGKEYGVIVLPEGLIEFIPEMQTLIQELNQLIAKGQDVSCLSETSKATFELLPETIQKQLLLQRDPHGNVQVSQIQTEQLLMSLVGKELQASFTAQDHFFGYEGRACFPSNFDADYAYTLGLSAAAAAQKGLTGVICAASNLRFPEDRWIIRFIPIVQMMHLEERKGTLKPVIAKTLVDRNGAPYLYYAANRKKWEIEDQYRYPGPIQFSGSSDLVDSRPQTLTV